MDQSGPPLSCARPAVADAEAAHREMLRRSEAKLTAQRRRLAALQGALRQRSSAQRHSERSRALLQQTTEKEMLIGRLQDEIKKKVSYLSPANNSQSYVALCFKEEDQTGNFVFISALQYTYCSL